jgi:hypothetical protein
MPEARHDIRIFEQVILGSGQQVLKQKRLSGAAQPSQHDRGKASGSREHLFFQEPMNVAHGLSFLN